MAAGRNPLRDNGMINTHGLIKSSKGFFSVSKPSIRLRLRHLAVLEVDVRSAEHQGCKQAPKLNFIKLKIWICQLSTFKFQDNASVSARRKWETRKQCDLRKKKPPSYWCCLTSSLPRNSKLQFDAAADSESIQDNDGFVLRCPPFLSSCNITPSDEWLKSNFQFILLLSTNWQMRKHNVCAKCMRDC